jgi:hypothetical protein
VQGAGARRCGIEWWRPRIVHGPGGRFGRHVLRLVNDETGAERRIVVRVGPGGTKRISVDLTDN